MPRFFRFILVLCAGWGLPAQSMSDLNSLVLSACRYAAHETEGQKPPPDLILYRIIGASGGPAGAVMTRPVDLQSWTLVYQVRAPGAPAPPVEPGDLPQSVSIQCAGGQFTGMVWSPFPVFDAKSLQWTWIAVTVDEAIAQLNRTGFTRGFTSLTVMRPMHPHISDECTFIFRCTPDHAYVGISAQTGLLLWTDPFPS